MPRIAYINKNFQDQAWRMIRHCNEIIEEYQAKGYSLTLRQLYYRLVALDLFPDERRWSWNERKKRWDRNERGTKNADPNYKWLGGIVSEGRMAGLVDWDAIEDRTRNLIARPKWANPREIAEAAHNSYKRDRWENQPYRVEVWVEKEALSGIVRQACYPLDVDYIACRGYMSQSEMWQAAQRFLRYIGDGQIPVIVHLGDHDPSGIDMSRDVFDRLETFMMDEYGEGIEVNRIALNYSQVEEYDPPPNPAKLTDSRVKMYIQKFGDESWELDALDPDTLVQLINSSVLSYRDDDLYREVWDREKEEKEQLWRMVTKL